MPAASANGRFARSPISIVPMKEAIQTAMRTAVPPIPAAERIPGLTARIYAIVINIVSPAEARF